MITDGGNATPVGLFPLPVGVLLRHYFVVVQLATSSKAGHAFRVSAAAGHITMSAPPQIGLPVTAANANRVVVDRLLPAFSMAPGSLDFGTVDVDDDSTAAIQISNAGAADLILSSLSSGDARFAARHASQPADLVVPAGDSRPVTVTFSPDTGGALATTLDLIHNDVSSPTQILLSGTCVAPANPAQLLPLSVDFGNIKYGSTAQSSFDMINNGGSTITISSIQSSHPSSAAMLQVHTMAPGETRSVELYFSATSLGTKTAALTIQQDGVVQPITLPVRADATVALNIGSLNFGSIVPGKTALLPLTIDNPSAAPVTITSIVSDNPAFVPDCSTCVIAAGDQQTIYVTFRPTSTQAQSARLSITHNPTLIVNLAANGFKDDFSQSLDADGKPLQTFAVPFGGEWLAGLLFCLYALIRRRAA